MNKNKQTAFTLIELLVVIVIIGILATVSTATFSGSIEKADFAKAQAFAGQIDRALSAYEMGLWDLDEGSGNTTFSRATTDLTPNVGNEWRYDTGRLSGDFAWSSDTPMNSSEFSVDLGGGGRVGTHNSKNEGKEYKTISFWFYTETEITEDTPFQPILNHGISYTVNAIIAGGLFGSSIPGYTLGIFQKGSDSVQRGTYMTEVIKPGWHHVAFIINESEEYDLYYDGKKKSVLTFGANGPAQAIEWLSGHVYFGGGGDTGLGSNFTGKIDNVRFFSEGIEF